MRWNYGRLAFAVFSGLCVVGCAFMVKEPWAAAVIAALNGTAWGTSELLAQSSAELSKHVRELLDDGAAK